MTDGRCDECGADIIDNCQQCGAPQCCPQCCRIERLESAIRHALADTLWDSSGRKLNLERILNDKS